MTDQDRMAPSRRGSPIALAYTDPAAARPIDALEIARTAMSAGSVRRWSVRLPGATLLGPQFAVLAWAVAAAAVVVVGVVGGGFCDGRPNPPSGPIADVLRHAWQRPLPVAGPTPSGHGVPDPDGGRAGGRAGTGCRVRSAIAARRP